TAKLTFTPMENQTFLFEAGRTTQERYAEPGKSLAEYSMFNGVKRDNTKSETHNNRNHMALTYKGDWDVIQTEVSVYQEQTKRKTKAETKDAKTGLYNYAYEARVPEITNTVVDGKVTAFLPDNILT